MGRKSKSRGWCGWFLVLIILALVVGAVVYTIKKRIAKSDDDSPVPGPPGAVQKKYADALNIAMQFFDVQKCITSSSFPIFLHILPHSVFLMLTL